MAVPNHLRVGDDDFCGEDHGSSHWTPVPQSLDPLVFQIYQILMGFSGTPNNGTPFMVSRTHTIPIRIPKDMGMVWEASHKGGPIVGGP